MDGIAVEVMDTNKMRVFDMTISTKEVNDVEPLSFDDATVRGHSGKVSFHVPPP